ncbi:hypothetical protein Efla_000527 [Eimeria flavescens]
MPDLLIGLQTSRVVLANVRLVTEGQYDYEAPCLAKLQSLVVPLDPKQSGLDVLLQNEFCCSGLYLFSLIWITSFTARTRGQQLRNASIETSQEEGRGVRANHYPNGETHLIRSENELLVDESGNQIPIVGVWESWITCSGQAGCILVDVVKGLPTKAVLGLDSFRALKLSVVDSGTSFELKAGGWQRRRIESILLCATKNHPSVASVGISQGLYDTDRRQSSFHSSLSIDYQARPCLYFTVDDDDSMWQYEAVKALQLGQREESSTFGCPNTNKSKRGRHDDRRFARLALCVSANSGESPPNSRDLSAFPKTFEEVRRMCSSTHA